MHSPLWQVSPVVQAFPSSRGVLSGSGVPAQTPPSQVSLLVQELLSSHAAPSSSAALPTQVPFWQVSAAVQELPSSQLVPVNGVTVQLAVPLQRSEERRVGKECRARWQTVPALEDVALQR